MGRKFGEFGKSSMIHQTKLIQISAYIYNLLAESIHLPIFFAKCSKQVNSPPNISTAKLSRYTIIKSCHL